MTQNPEDTGQISVAELLARNGGQSSSSGGRRRRGNKNGISVAELTGEQPVVRADATHHAAVDDVNAAAPQKVSEPAARTGARAESAAEAPVLPSRAARRAAEAEASAQAAGGSRRAPDADASRESRRGSDAEAPGLPSRRSRPARESDAPAQSGGSRRAPDANTSAQPSRLDLPGTRPAPNPEPQAPSDQRTSGGRAAPDAWKPRSARTPDPRPAAAPDARSTAKSEGPDPRATSTPAAKSGAQGPARSSAAPANLRKRDPAPDLGPSTAAWPAPQPISSYLGDAKRAPDVGADDRPTDPAPPRPTEPTSRRGRRELAKTPEREEETTTVTAWSVEDREPELLSGASVASELLRKRTEAPQADAENEDEADVDAAGDEVAEPAPARNHRREWLLLGVEALSAIVVGALLFKGFERLWEMMPVIALALAVIVIVGMVALVRVLRKTDDIMSTVIAIVVGIFVTIGPLAFLLTTN